MACVRSWRLAAWVRSWRLAAWVWPWRWLVVVCGVMGLFGVVAGAGAEVCVVGGGEGDFVEASVYVGGGQCGGEGGDEAVTVVAYFFYCGGGSSFLLG